MEDTGQQETWTVKVSKEDFDGEEFYVGRLTTYPYFCVYEKSPSRAFRGITEITQLMLDKIHRDID